MTLPVAFTHESCNPNVARRRISWHEAGELCHILMITFLREGKCCLFSDYLWRPTCSHSVRELARNMSQNPEISHFSLPDLLPPSQTLVLNRKTHTLSLLAGGGPTLIMAQHLSANEMRVLVPLLESYPHYCPYEVLLAHIFSNVVTEVSIEHCRQRLQEAQQRGTWQQELRPLRRALSSLRSKLDYFDLGISNLRERGCSLISLRSLPLSTSNNERKSSP
jgi:hypothetical protein